MPIKMTTPREAIEAYVNKRLSAMHTQIIRNLCFIGEQCRNEAKAHRYVNRTGNLESSVGYVVVDNGQVVGTGGFEPVLDGSEGAEEGKQYALSLASQHSSGLCLIVVAGKSYAKYVNDRGLNVLDSAQSLAERLVPQMVKDLM